MRKNEKKLPEFSVRDSSEKSERQLEDERFLAMLDRRFSNLYLDSFEKKFPIGECAPIVDADPTALVKRMNASLEAERVRMEKRARNTGAVSVPERGLGPTVYIGFDAEWEKLEAGKNQLLSVQFHLIGMDGCCEQVLHFKGRMAGKRPKLSDAISQLLLKAMDENVIEDWPRDVVLVGFFTRADITVFSDFSNLRPQLDGVNGTLVSVKKPMEIDINIKPGKLEKLKLRYTGVVNDGYDFRLLKVRLVDASRLAPVGYSLRQVGDLLNIQKVDIPQPYSIERMAEFQKKDIKSFELYGLVDAKIAVEYVLFVLWMSKRHLELDGLSITAGGVAVKMAKKCIAVDGMDFDKVFNLKTIAGLKKYGKNGKQYTQKPTVFPTDDRRWTEAFLADTYSGGRNECYAFGGTEPSKFYDHDLSSAYLIGLAYVKALDYVALRRTRNVADFCGHVAGYAKVKFSFPESIKYPCLPVTVENRGLYFPSSGVSLCTAPEIELARSMEAEIEIEYGIVIPWKDGAALQSEGLPKEVDVDGYRPFLGFARRVRELRQNFPKKSLLNEFVKLIGNSLYGKTGQGLKQKKAFGVRELDSVVIAPSPVTEPAFASLVCGFVRAVLGEILWKASGTANIVSATTDGFLIDVALDQLDLTGEMSRRFAFLCEMVTGVDSILECKHQVKQVVAIRTRGQLTGERDGSHPIVLAKTSVNPPVGTTDANGFMVDLFMNRQPGQKIAQRSLTSMRDQILQGSDLQMETGEVTLNLEFDFKRKPVNPRIQSIRGIPHLSFETVPWQCASEGVLARTVFDQWRKTGCLKTMEDWNDWMAFYNLSVGNQRRMKKKHGNADGLVEEKSKRGRSGRIHCTSDGYAGIARRTFLCAYTRSAWGLVRELTYPALAAWLTEKGFKTSVNDLKNASKSVLHEHSVPHCDEVHKFLSVVGERFPQLAVHMFYINEGGIS